MPATRAGAIGWLGSGPCGRLGEAGAPRRTMRSWWERPRAARGTGPGKAAVRWWPPAPPVRVRKPGEDADSDRWKTSLLTNLPPFVASADRFCDPREATFHE